MSATLSPLRCRITRKPWPAYEDLFFYSCAVCGQIWQPLHEGEPAHTPHCCGKTMPRMLPRLLTADEVVLDYKVVGGFDQSAVQLFWQEGARPQWAALKTFTGCYGKQVPEKKQAPLVFPLADEDAYVYCDRAECEQCVFRCKKGFVLYALVPGEGLLALPLDRMQKYFQIKK